MEGLKNSLQKVLASASLTARFDTAIDIIESSKDLTNSVELSYLAPWILAR